MKIKKYKYYHGIKPKFLNFSNNLKLSKERTENSVKCICGHSVEFPAYLDKRICNWCHRTVYNNTKSHFKYKLRKVQNEEKR